MTELAPSNFKLIESEFGDIILDSKPVDKNGLPSNMHIQRRTYKLTGGSTLYVVEHIKDNKIDEFFYDWYFKEGTERLKFHKEPHTRDKRYQTSTEPFHIHTPENTRLTNISRLPNVRFRELAAVMEHIRLALGSERDLGLNTKKK